MTEPNRNCKSTFNEQYPCQNRNCFGRHYWVGGKDGSIVICWSEETS